MPALIRPNAKEIDEKIVGKDWFLVRYGISRGLYEMPFFKTFW